MVVGLDFYTTSPAFLESFLSVIRIGKGLQGGTFHPKLYLFEIADRFGCVMGSSNFTRGGWPQRGTEYLHRGQEVGCLLSGSSGVHRGTGKAFGPDHSS